tara:strand:- start:326 stop:802 length:477 start_codon:yes stop_codon:yes gene_type:complete
MKKLHPLLSVLFLFLWSCEEEVVGDTNNEEVYEVDRLYGIWFRDSSDLVTNGDTSWVFNDINDQEKVNVWISNSENESNGYLYLPPWNCYSLDTMSITWEKVDDMNFKSVGTRDDGSTIEFYFYFKNDYDGMYVRDNSTTFNSHYTKLEDWDLTPLCD